MPFADFGFIAIVSLLMGIIAIRTLYQMIRDRKRLFDDRFTRWDRQQLSTAAFFVLVPINVFLHEVGHAVAVWYYGGEVLRFGYFLFFGFVQHRGFYTEEELFWIALSGNLVSIGLGIGAIAWVVLRPMRAALNYLLIMFGVISLLIALVFYPLMDLLSDLHGDWSQIYRSETMVHSTVTGVFHAAILIGAVALWQVDRVRRRYGELTGLSPEAMRRISGADAGRELLQAGEQAASELDLPVRVVAGQVTREIASAQLEWTSGGYRRAVTLVTVLNGPKRIELHGAIRALDGSDHVLERRVATIDGIPKPERVAPAVVRAARVVDGWRLGQTPADPDEE
jgi:hypothetical protein